MSRRRVRSPAYRVRRRMRDINRLVQRAIADTFNTWGRIPFSPAGYAIITDAVQKVLDEIAEPGYTVEVLPLTDEQRRTRMSPTIKLTYRERKP